MGLLRPTPSSFVQLKASLPKPQAMIQYEFVTLLSQNVWGNDRNIGISYDSYAFENGVLLNFKVWQIFVAKSFMNSRRGALAASARGPYTNPA